MTNCTAFKRNPVRFKERMDRWDRWIYGSKEVVRPTDYNKGSDRVRELNQKL
jgi:hypothetical protein